MPPIGAERCISARDLSEPRLSADGASVVFGVAEREASYLQVVDIGGGAGHRLAESPALRPARGLGGGSWCFLDDDSVVYVGADGNLWRQGLAGGATQRLTDHGPDANAASPCATGDGRHVVYVVDMAEVRSVDVATRRSRRLDEGRADFVLDPSCGPDGTIAWLAWNVPDMPWNHTRVEQARIGGGRVADVLVPAALSQPRLRPDGRCMSVRDTSGWMNVHLDDEPLVAEPFEHAGPTWGPGQCTYVWSPDGTQVAFARNEGGFGRLCVVHCQTGEVREVAKGVHAQLSWNGDRLAAIRTGARTPTQVVVYDTRTWDRSVVATGPSGEWSDGELPEPELVEVPTATGPVHARLYRATAPARALIVWLHGGPTDQWMVTFMPRVAFWTSRGFNILVPDHRGSTGHGRTYQQALQGRWGELDVDDTIDATRYAQEQGWGSLAGTALMGSSSGGFTALGAVAATSGLFSAAVVLYPVTDLFDMAERSHRFERHYSYGLVGALPDAAERYRRRSPAWHADRLVGTPLLILHGELDAVVPVQQSQILAERVLAAGGDVELHVYPGEGHGFRERANQLDEYDRIERFLAGHLGVASGS